VAFEYVEELQNRNDMNTRYKHYCYLEKIRQQHPELMPPYQLGHRMINNDAKYYGFELLRLFMFFSLSLMAMTHLFFSGY
jgi:hypothetical protein